MKRRISSLYTPLLKLIPVPLISGVLILLIIGFLRRPSALSSNGLVVMAILLSALAFFSWHSSRLKFVSIDEDNLYVSGLFEGCIIPLSEVEYVYYSGGVGLVVVRLKSESYFGNTIAFMPTWGLFVNSHPIVEELRELAAKASAK